VARPRPVATAMHCPTEGTRKVNHKPMRVTAANWNVLGHFSALVDPNKVFRQAIEEHLQVVHQLSQQQDTLELIAIQMIETVLSGGKVLWCGNGGSAADCQHLSAEFVGRFRLDRRGLASVALTTDTSVLTAIGNDYGFNEIFRRQIQALCAPGDVVVGISTSGNSRNVCSALNEAKNIGAFTACFTGIDGGEIATIGDAILRVASRDTARIQEAHILAGHVLCDWVELAVCSCETKLARGTK
jgi:D-sedoheptulose 7-phosphate isomerase